MSQIHKDNIRLKLVLQNKHGPLITTEWGIGATDEILKNLAISIESETA